MPARYKVVPEPLGVETLRAVRDAVPLVPERVEDCCTRVVDRTNVPSRDRAREWITFLQALDLVDETPRGFRRVRTDPDRETLAETFVRRVFGVRELLDALDAAGPCETDELFDRVRQSVPGWERDRHTDWEREWRERTARLLEWSVAFGLVVREGDAWRLAEHQ